MVAYSVNSLLQNAPRVISDASIINGRDVFGTGYVRRIALLSASFRLIKEFPVVSGQASSFVLFFLWPMRKSVNENHNLAHLGLNR